MSTEPPKPPVGYKSPPLHSRFQKGQSGNPSGKRKAANKTIVEDYREIVLSQLVPTIIGGKRIKLTARHALYQKLLAMSLQGDLKAMALLLKFEGLNENAVSLPQGELVKEEEALIASYIARRAKNEGRGE